MHPSTIIQMRIVVSVPICGLLFYVYHLYISCRDGQLPGVQEAVTVCAKCEQRHALNQPAQHKSWSLDFKADRMLAESRAAASPYKLNKSILR